MITVGYPSTIEVDVYTDAQIPLTATFRSDVEEDPATIGEIDVIASTTDITVISTEANTDTSINGAFVAVLSIGFTALMTASWTARTVILDVVRTDTAVEQYMGFKLRVTPDYPITRPSP